MRAFHLFGAIALTFSALAAPALAGEAATYPLDTCPISGKKITGMAEPVTLEHEGREIRFCCKGCPSKFTADPAGVLAKIDAAIVKQQADLFPLDKCVVSGHGLKDMGEPFVKVYGNRAIKLCCEGCAEGFAADPAKFLAEIDAAAIEKQLPTYPATTCPVSGKPLGDGAKNVVFAGRLVRFCCGGCPGSLKKDPTAILNKVFGEAKG